MPMRLKRLLCIMLAAVSIMLMLPLSVSAKCKTCSYGGTQWAEAIHPHPYFYYCNNGCGNKQYTGSYMTKSNCASCNSSIRNCSHTSAWTNNAHPHETVCTGCCRVMNQPSYPSSCWKCCESAGGHYGSSGGWTETTHQPGGYHDQYYTCTRCGTSAYKGVTYKYNGCTVCNPPVQSSVSMYATGPENTIWSSGILATTNCPASYTVSASPTNCYVTSMYYYDSMGRQTVSYGSSISFVKPMLS